MLWYCNKDLARVERLGEFGLTWRLPDSLKILTSLSYIAAGS